MKTIRLRLLAAALAVLLGTTIARSQTTDATDATPAPSASHGQWGHHRGMLRFYTHLLNLSEAQQSQIKAIMQKERPTMKPLMQQLHQTQLQLKQYEEGAYDEAKVRTLATQQSQNQVELTVQKTRIHNEIFQVLTPDQQEKLKQFEANREARMQKHMQGESSAPADQ